MTRKSRDLVPAKKAQAEADAMEQENDLAMQAYQLRSAGTPWWEISTQLGISEHRAASMVARRIATAARLVDEGAKRTMLAMEIDRLDQLQQAIWDRALGGDTRAVETILRIITTRAKILGLEDATATSVTNNTIVVAGDSDQYIAALQAAVHREPNDAH